MRENGAEVTIKTSIEMPRALWRRVGIRAAEEETRRREILIRALEAYLATPAKASRGKRGPSR